MKGTMLNPLSKLINKIFLIISLFIIPFTVSSEEKNRPAYAMSSIAVGFNGWFLLVLAQL